LNIRVLHSIASIDPSYGGPVAVVKGLIHSLNNLGVTPGIFTCSTGDPALDRTNALAFPEVDIIWIKPIIKRFYWNPFICLKIGNSLKTFDLFHVHGVFNGISSSLCHIAKALNIPYILEPFGTLSPYCLRKNSLMKKISLYLWELKNIENAAAIKFTSELEFQRFTLNFRTLNGFVAGNGIDWAEFGHLPSPGKFRQNFNIGKEEMIFMFLGRLQPIKGLEIFLPAFIEWSKSQLNRFRCVIAGPDEAGYRERLENLSINLKADDTILFTGPLFGTDRIQAMVDSDVIVLPSFHENFGITAVEGMACGKPVLISDQVDIWAEVKKYDLGEIGSATVEGMIDVLNRIVARKKEWTDIGQRGRNWAQENCNWDSIAEVVLSEYESVLKNREYISRA
jgi:glycosyltransferase involved in cell wall biosynthesis